MPSPGSFHEEVELRIKELVGNASLADWSVQPGSAALVEIALTVTYRVAFGSVLDGARPGPLPASVHKHEPAQMRWWVETLRATKQRTVQERLEPWLLEHAGSCAHVLDAAACLGSAPSFGYEFACDGCITADCELCEGKRLRHVTGTASCHVGRDVALVLNGLPENAPAQLRDLEALRKVADLALVEQHSESGLVRLRYQGELAIEQCELTVHGETHTVWSIGPRERAYALAVERLLEPLRNELRDALEQDTDVPQAARAFFEAPLHASLALADEPEAKDSVRAELISEKYLSRAHKLAQDAMVAMARAGRRTHLHWLLLLPPLLALSLHAAPISRLLAGLAGAVLAVLMAVLVALQERSSLRNTWGIALPRGVPRAPLAVGMVSVLAAFVLAGIPSALPLRVLHAAGARDRVTGIYENGDERLLVLPTARNAYVVRHVTPDCDDFALVELHLTGDFVRGDTPFVRSEGPSFVLLPNQAEGCGERAEPARFTRSTGMMTCTVASQHARPVSLAKKPFRLAAGAQVEVLPWAPNMRQVLVRADDQIGTLAASELTCPKRGLSTLRDELFTRIESAQR